MYSFRYGNVDGQLITKIVNSLVTRHDDMSEDLLHIQASGFFDNDFSPFDDHKSKKLEYVKLSMPENVPVGLEEDYKAAKHAVHFPIDLRTDLGKKDTAFDFIFADFPFGFKPPNEKDHCLLSLEYLKPHGIGIYLMPSYLSTILSNKGKKFLNDIVHKGFKVLSVIQLPKDFMRPTSGMQSTLLLISRDNGVKETFFTKYLDDDVDFWSMQSSITAHGIWSLHTLNLLLAKDSETIKEFNKEMRKIVEEYVPEELEITEANLFDGIEENILDFEGFEYWEQDKEIEKLDSEYGGYSLIELQELAEIKSTKESFKENKDALYIPAIGKTEVTDILPNENSPKKPQNYYQVIIKDKRILKDYLLNFLNSEPGQRAIKLEFSKYSSSTISRLRVADVKGLGISVPNLGIQAEIVENVTKLKKLQKLLSEIEDNLSIRPISSTDQLDKLNQIYESSIDLSDSEKVFNDIKKGESTSREFKQTFTLDIATKSRNKDLAFGCVKTVAGFMNRSGGTLYIGVADNAEITGVEVEVGKKQIYKSLDIYTNDIKNILVRRIGRASMKNIEFIPIMIRGKQILLIECEQSDHQVYVDNHDTYLRVGPSTHKLEGHDLVTFSKERFK